MAFCGQCGASVAEGNKFCPNCGAAMGNQQNTQAGTNGQPNQTGNNNNQQYQTGPNGQPNQNNFTNQVNDFGNKIAGLNNTADTTYEYHPQDIADNKAFAILSYFGLLVLIPIFAAPNSRYARYHANQGLLLLILEVAYGVVQALLGVMLRFIFPWNWSYGYFGGRGAVYGIITALLNLAWIAIVVLIVIGVINAATGKAKELPIIGKIKILK